MKIFPTFQGGQIKTECRGDKVAIITPSPRSEGYITFLDNMGGKDYLHFTGKGYFNNPIKRIYLGINEAAVNCVAREARSLEESDLEEGLRRIDGMVVIPHFLTKQPFKKTFLSF